MSDRPTHGAGARGTGARGAVRPALLRSVSGAVLAVLISSLPQSAFGQLAAVRGSPLTAPTILPGAVPGQIRSAAQTGALDRQVAAQTRAQQIRTFATQAKVAVAQSVVNGLAVDRRLGDGTFARTKDGGLVAIAAVRHAIADRARAADLRAAGDPTQAAALEAEADGLVKGVTANADLTGLATWQGASLPTESVTGSTTLVQITQQDSRAILSWDKFDIGAQTTLQIDQKVGTVAQKDWVAVNRVVDPNANGSLILGQIKADGIVVVLNRNGVLFGQGSQVSANSLLASSLDIGHAFKLGSNGPGNSGFIGTSVRERNLGFLQNGLVQSTLDQGSVSLAGELTSAVVSGFYGLSPIVLDGAFDGVADGGVAVERGASLTAGTGGFVILTGSTVANDGTLTAAEGEVALQAGKAITVTPSTGASDSPDSFVRGLILRTAFGNTGTVRNSGLISTPLGYAGLGAGLSGSVTNAGLISATTSVSRNGTISLLAGTVTLSGAASADQAGGLVITPDTNGETIPQGTASAPAAFKTSQIRIGAAYIDPVDAGAALGDFGPSAVTVDANALIYAPSANVQIGGAAGDDFTLIRYDGTNVIGAAAALARSKVDVVSGALIDVSGIKDLQLSAERNSLLINATEKTDPDTGAKYFVGVLKRNELRDTPTYRETTTDGSFTLNGASVYIDPRLSGVRSDGVAWVGSPLLEAGSAVSQIPVTAAELMTKGGTVTLTSATVQGASTLAAAPKVTVAAGATVDISGGWVAYQAGSVRSSRLLTADGRVVNIEAADPNEAYVAVGDGVSDVQAAFGVNRTYANSVLRGLRFENAYDEGRVAGALIVSGSAMTLDGTLFADAFAGSRQRSAATAPTLVSTLAGDTRRLQATATQLPTGGYLRVGSFGNSAQNGDIYLGSVKTGLAEGTTVLDPTALGASGLATLSLRTTGGVTLAKDSTLALANGGGLSILSGRSVDLSGNVAIVSGTISVTTRDFGRDGRGVSSGSIGSPFRADDDLRDRYASDPSLSPFDISVTGKLSTAGRWTNDFLGDSLFQGSAWQSGGSIALTVAANVTTLLGSDRGLDLSGSIHIAPTAELNVSAGGYVSNTGDLVLDGRGGNVSLINATLYASTNLTDNTSGSSNNADQALGGTNQSVRFTPYALIEESVVSALVPDVARATVDFSVGSIKGFGFAGGGTFTLVAPDIAMGGASADQQKGPRIGLDFLQRTGFGTLDLTANKSKLIQGLFNNGRGGTSAFVDTARFEIGAGETLDLTQWLLPSVFSQSQVATLVNLSSGSDIRSVLAPLVPVEQWDRRAANLKLGGVSELDVLAGGSITGAAEATITVPRLYNAGTIRIAGGSIRQYDSLEQVFPIQRTVGVRSAELGGGGLADIFGGSSTGQQSGFDENAPVKLDIFADLAGKQRLTNGQLFSLIDPAQNRNIDAHVVFTGRVALNEGLHFAAGSVTDLSGTALYNPRASLIASNVLRDVAGNPLSTLSGQVRKLEGRLVAGGSISSQLAAFGSALVADGYASPIDPSGKLVAEATATIRLDGASGLYDELLNVGTITRATQWSDAGSLTVGNGALLAGATLSAKGGDDGDSDTSRTKAAGGILDWTAPVIGQTGNGPDLSGSWLSANQIQAAGFDTLVARGGLTTSGVVDLTLGRSLIATTTRADGLATIDNLVISAAPGSRARIKAGYISLFSSNRSIGQLRSAGGEGNLTLSANAIDVVGSTALRVSSGTAAGSATGGATLEASGDIRFIGAQGIPDPATGLLTPGLTGQLVSNGNLTLTAAQVFATTGTGNLQQLLEDQRAGKVSQAAPYVVASTNVDGTVTILGNGTTPEVPWSAGSWLALRGAHIEQDGVLRAPLGLLDIGANTTTSFGSASAPATKSVHFGKDSLTSVSARTSANGTDARSVPYGSTTDLLEYFFTPGTNSVLSTMPVGELRVAGGDISIDSASATDVRVDVRGGGDVFAYEFISGTGGSRDVLDRFNTDAFSGNAGLQFADGRQVYAILPKNSASVALYDPVYSADYHGGGGTDIYGIDAGRTVTLDAAPGIAAGEYLLLPAHYALIPGAMRLVENTGTPAPLAGGATTLLDGSVVVAGVYGTAGTGLAQSQRRSFTLQTKDVFSLYSRIQTSALSTTVTKAAEHANVLAPRLAVDAARVVISPLTSLKVAGAFASTAATGGIGSQVDIGGNLIRIAAPGAVADADLPGYLVLTTDTLASLNANSLSIGALRTDQKNGTTGLAVTGQKIWVDADVDFSAPELILAVGGRKSEITIADAPRLSTGAQLRASGVLQTRNTGDYIVNPDAAPSDGTTDDTGAGAVLRLANGPERAVSRVGETADANSILPARLKIGRGTTLGASAITMDTSRGFAIDRTATVGAATSDGVFDLIVSADNLRIGGVAFRPEVEAQFAQARHLTYRTPDLLTFSQGIFNYHDLTIDAEGLALFQPVQSTTGPTNVTLNAAHLTLKNSSNDLRACSDLGARVCGALRTLTINADDITFGDGTFRTYGFDAGLTGTGVTLNAAHGMYVSGKGSFTTLNLDGTLEVPLNLRTPFIVDRTAQKVGTAGYVRPDYTFTTGGALTVSGTGMTAVVPTDQLAPGARIAFVGGTSGYDLSINDTLVRATAGQIEVTSSASLALAGTTSLQVGGYTKTFDDGLTKTTVTAGGGLIKLASTGLGSEINAAATTSLVVDNGIGAAGTLQIAGTQSTVNLAAALNPGVSLATPRAASLLLDTAGAFDFGGFVATYGSRFQGDIVIRAGTDDLSLAQGQTLKADSLSLTADDGLVTIAGVVDTSGDDVHLLAVNDPVYKAARIDGGAISLFGQNGVTLGSTARLISRTSGYAADDARQASGGTVTIGIGTPLDPAVSAAIRFNQGAIIDVAALQTSRAPIAETVTDPLTQLQSTVYRFAAADLGGTLNLRAPLLAGNQVAVFNQGSVTGAREKTLEAYRTFNLDKIVADGTFSGITAGSDGFSPILDASEVIAGKANFLADLAPGTLPDFVRNFQVAGTDGDAFADFRKRPGLQLTSAYGIQLKSNWNFGAGQIVNSDGTAGYADALAAGLLVTSPLGAYQTGPLAGQQRYEIVAGSEAELFNRFVDMTYRVGGKVSGEAPVLTLRATGNIDIAHSISDGFFAFHDLTDADYISYQLGGGTRTFNPALRLGCGINDAASCGDSTRYADAPHGRLAYFGPRININVLAALQGSESSPLFVNAPFNPLANAVAAGGTGDPLGVAELFPLLTGGQGVHSTTYKVVAGAVDGSSNPLQTDATAVGTVKISGETSYTVAVNRGSASLKGSLDLLPGIGRDIQPIGLDALLATINSGSDSDLNGEFYTLLNWGAGQTQLVADIRAAALSWSGFVGKANFIGSDARPLGVAARLRDIVRFLKESGFGEQYAAGVTSGKYASSAALVTPIVNLKSKTVFVGTTMRTGDGSIDLAAAVDVDLRRFGGVTMRADPAGSGRDPAQVGGTAVYTAGIRAATTDLAAMGLVGAVPTLAGMPSKFVPGPSNGLATVPVFSKGGGAISIVAGHDVLGRRDVWAELYGQSGSAFVGVSSSSILAARAYPQTTASLIPTFGLNSSTTQSWRYGLTSQDETLAAVAYNRFTSGVGALAGGDVTIRAGNDVSDLTVALDNSLVTANRGGVPTLVSFGAGDLSVTAAGNLLGGQFDISSGRGVATVGGNVMAADGSDTQGAYFGKDARNLLQVRIADATFDLTARGSVTIGGLGALSVSRDQISTLDTLGFFSATAGFSALGNENVTLVNNRAEFLYFPTPSTPLTVILPPSLEMTSLFGDIGLGQQGSPVLPGIMAASRYGQLSLLAGGSAGHFGLAMSDAAASNMFGTLDALAVSFPEIFSTTSDSDLRRLHNRSLTHLLDQQAARIVVGGDLTDVVLSLPKQAEIRAGGSIIDLMFEGQNLRASDVTKVTAGGDITGTTLVSSARETAGRSAVMGNNIVVGGPGSLFVEAGRDLGPFVTSATGIRRSEAGGIRTIGNDHNPWLDAQGANIYALFGVANGADYQALQTMYLDPARLTGLDGDLFVQTKDELGNAHPDRTRYTYAPVLAEWLRDNAPVAFAAVFGVNAPTGTALTTAAYGRYGDLYAAFAALPQVSRNRFLIDKLYFGELAATSDPSSPSFNQYIRGYRAVQALFPTSLGYTDNLATYYVSLDKAKSDPTYLQDHPFGEAVKIVGGAKISGTDLKLANGKTLVLDGNGAAAGAANNIVLTDGQPAAAKRVVTGNVDLRLSTIETSRGGNVTILGPGGDFVAGSVVRSSAQVARRLTALNVSGDADPTRDLEAGNYNATVGASGLIKSIPSGYEGVLTLRSGEIRGFTDGSMVLNQSRMFTRGGGDISLWSSNGDLNAGQGPRNSSNFPPIVLRFTQDGFSEVNSAGSISGAGIGAFKVAPEDPESTIRLIAPVGTVDAGDAGVRASGNVFVAAARVANADSFSAGGSIAGVPALTSNVAPPAPASAASAISANAFNANSGIGDNAQRQSRIFVDVLGYVGGPECPEGQAVGTDGQCH